MFNDNWYFTGFVKEIEKVGVYEFQKKYVVDFFFPSVEREDEKKLKLKSKDNRLQKICAGKKIIGEAYIVEYQYDGNK